MNIFEALLWLTLNIYHEARSDPPMAQIAVGHVVLNRVKDSGDTVKEVVLKDKQFSWVHQKSDYYPHNTSSFLVCLKSALIASRGFDFTMGSTFYHTRSTSPYWASSKEIEYVATFGSHRFYR